MFANIEFFVVFLELFLSELDVFPVGATSEQALLLVAHELRIPPFGVTLAPDHVLVEVLVEGFDGGHGSEDVERVDLARAD